MSYGSRKWFYALAACVAASLYVGSGAAAAATLPGIGMTAPHVQNNAIPVGYRHSPYYSEDYFYWPSEYDTPGYYGDWPSGSGYYEPQDYVWRPSRPTSCGEYHYWDGQCCVDARRYRPDLGRRW